jgi:hypothetical protein
MKIDDFKSGTLVLLKTSKWLFESYEYIVEHYEAEQHISRHGKGKIHTLLASTFMPTNILFLDKFQSGLNELGARDNIWYFHILYGEKDGWIQVYEQTIQSQFERINNEV